MLNKLKEFIYFIRDLFHNRELILDLAKNDFKVRYAGSYFGIVWGFVQPIITIFIFWFVFQVGFKSQPVSDVPFILWLICGMIPWFFFSEAWNSATGCLYEYSYLVKKVVFRVSVLPIVKIVSALFIHLFFIGFLFLMFGLYGFPLHIVNLQVIYYLFSTIMVVIALSWFTSALAVFLKDMTQIMAIIIQLGFWLTPIFWNYEILPPKYMFLFKVNPMFYIVQGYRDTFINHVWFWERYNQTMYFWVVTAIIFILGALFFRRVRPHFSDVL
ncbi:lipopolysaccharide transport system permease protein [Natronincola peptidivorans]|uniref:Transport permease protein n=1 Tax=Natronincola peptidivorans TaxID=426128 RepID=A0A1I0CS68_9FIRM|nr:ABC transporter permease [Natronincola peptidivorans]SET21910.1 lipopolysaccharide transport system permease protein [Natronincola peptidivorans]